MEVIQQKENQQTFQREEHQKYTETTQSTESDEKSQSSEDNESTQGEALKSLVKSIESKTHLKGLTAPSKTHSSQNLFRESEFKEEISYEDDGKRNLIRTKEGLIVLKHIPMMKIQANIAASVLKQVAQKIFTGKGLRGLNLPIEIFEPRTYLQQSAIGVSLLPKFLKEAAQEKSPEEQMKRIIAFLCTLQNFSIIWKQPLNPILGETYSAFLDKDTEIHLEQISHHPPLSYFYITNPEFKCYGHFQAKPKLRLPNVSVKIEGRMNIQFLNSGNRYVLTQPNLRIKGVMTGGRKFIVEGDGYVYGMKDKVGKGIQGKMGKFDPKNFSEERYFSHVHFGGGKSHGLFGKKKGAYDFFEGDTVKFSEVNTMKSLDDYFLGNEKERNDVNIDKVVSKSWKKGIFSEKNCIHKINGFWTNKVKINTDEYKFYIGKQKVRNIKQSTKLLPSDSCFRMDLLNILLDELETAQKAKRTLEENQRYDEKLRKEYSKKKN